MHLVGLVWFVGLFIKQLFIFCTEVVSWKPQNLACSGMYFVSQALVVLLWFYETTVIQNIFCTTVIS